ncbi:hypothetical protein [Desulfonatronovibrio hydrogenovorans]|uniref:hypothetical protein n=1 Tax=Desulfonatronovibrio hydrogenovorans TaxID=53245 RepID=UPI00048BEE64|nr:hypothetical protein [Desulfonatronovibrio hydrogenovorans]
MSRLITKLNKVFLGIFAFVGTIAATGIQNLGATTIQWHFHDMHGEVEGATRLIDPINMLVPFLIMVIIGLAFWRVNKKEKQEKVDQNDNSTACRTSN